jgi:hypothetical protein
LWVAGLLSRHLPSGIGVVGHEPHHAKTRKNFVNTAKENRVKNRLRSAFVLACFLLVVNAPAAFAELSAAQKQAAEALIRDFSSKEWTFANDRSGLRLAVRQKAVERLIGLGPDVVPLVKKALAETPDNEVKLRCEMVLKGIAEKFPDRIGAVKGADQIDVEPSKVTLSVKDSGLPEVLQMLADQSGNALIRVPKQLEGRTVTLDLKDTPYWEAVGKVCDAAGLTCRALAGVTLQDGAATPGTSVSSGPVAVKLDSASVRRVYRGEQRQGHLSYLVGYLWEDRLPVIAAHIAFTKATAPGGAELNLAGAGQFQDYWAWTRTFSQSGSSCGVFIQDPPEGIDRLGELSGILRLDFGVGEKQVRIENVFAPGEHEGTEGGLTIKVMKAANEGNMVTIQMQALRDGKPAALPAPPIHARYGFRLVGPDGKPHPPDMIGGSMEVRLEAAAGKLAVAAQAPAANPNDIHITFLRLGATQGEWALVYVFPETGMSKDYTFKFVNVPVR